MSFGCFKIVLLWSLTCCYTLYTMKTPECLTDTPVNVIQCQSTTDLDSVIIARLCDGYRDCYNGLDESPTYCGFRGYNGHVYPTDPNICSPDPFSCPIHCKNKGRGCETTYKGEKRVLNCGNKQIKVIYAVNIANESQSAFNDGIDVTNNFTICNGRHSCDFYFMKLQLDYVVIKFECRDMHTTYSTAIHVSSSTSKTSMTSTVKPTTIIRTSTIQSTTSSRSSYPTTIFPTTGTSTKHAATMTSTNGWPNTHQADENVTVETPNSTMVIVTPANATHTALIAGTVSGIFAVAIVIFAIFMLCRSFIKGKVKTGTGYQKQEHIADVFFEKDKGSPEPNQKTTNQSIKRSNSAEQDLKHGHVALKQDATVVKLRRDPNYRQSRFKDNSVDCRNVTEIGNENKFDPRELDHNYEVITSSDFCEQKSNECEEYGSDEYRFISDDENVGSDEVR